MTEMKIVQFYRQMYQKYLFKIHCHVYFIIFIFNNVCFVFSFSFVLLKVLITEKYEFMNVQYF